MRAALLGCVLLLVAAMAGVAAEDPRSHEVVNYRCTTSLGYREVTLFGNGTVRLKVRHEEETSMRLKELTPDETDAMIRRLQGEVISEEVFLQGGPQGDWVERCVFAMELPEDELRTYSFHRFDTLPLELSRLIRIGEDLLEQAELGLRTSNFPINYSPEAGDVLERLDGHHFRVVNFSEDQQGVELHGIDQPLVLYIRRGNLLQEFGSLVSRRP